MAAERLVQQRARLALAITAAATAFACRTDRMSHIVTDVHSDLRWSLVTARTTARRPPPTSRAATAPPTSRATAPAGPVVAVFDIEDKGVGLDPDTRSRLSDYLASRLAATARYQVVPRDQLKQRLVAQKRASQAACYERSCQIEIGRELAAQRSLSTQLIMLGSRCMVTAVVYDLRRSASVGGASVSGGCTEDDIVRSIEVVTAKLAGGQ